MKRSSGHARRLQSVLSVVLLAVSPASAQAPEGPAITGIRFWSLDYATRIAIEASGDFQYRSGRLADPDRVYFDILGARPALTGEPTHTVRVGDRLLKQIRIAEPEQGYTRVVLDLAAPAEFSSAQLANPNRLMIELRPAAQKPVTAPEPAAAPPAVPKPPPSQETTTARPSKSEPQEAAKAAPAGAPQPARRDQTGRRSLVRALGLKLARVVLDPGHGGHDTGTIGRGGLTEKELVLDVALRLGKLIEERLGAEVVYTRTDDTFVPLEERTVLANEREADLFLSIHANSGARSAAGPETYYLNFSGSPGALEVAARENASSEKTIHELQDLLKKIALTNKLEESREFAARIQSSLVVMAARNNREAKDRGVRQAPFVVLIGVSMPSVLAEIGFVTHPREEKLLKRAVYRQRVAEALFRGLSNYAASLSHFQVAEKRP